MLRDYYLTHTITFDVEKYFLDRVKQYNRWTGYEIMAAAVEQGRKRYEHRLGLLRKCGELRASREEDPTREKNELITILQARLETDTQAKFMNDPINGSGSCIDASRYWIYGEDKAKFRARTDLMLDVAEMNKEFAQIVLEVLNFRFATNYSNLEEWKRWWTSPRSTDANNKPMTQLQAPANHGAISSVEVPFSIKQYHVQYDVKADGTYSELDEIVMNVDTEMGIQIAKQFPLGMPRAGFKIGKRDVDVLTAYTLKKNGQHIEAIRLNPQQETLPSTGDTMMMPAFAQAKMVAFQDVAVGDSLVFSYKVIQKEAASPGNVAFTQIFPNLVAYDDVVISLSAPAALNLQIETVGIEVAKATDIGGIRNWVWKYQNKKSEDLQTGKSVPFGVLPRIHISSFKDMATEMAALMVEPPTPKDQAAETAPLIPKQPAGK